MTTTASGGCPAPPTSCPQATAIAQQAADLAVCKFFELLGVDVRDPRQVEDFRRDLRFGGSMRRAADRGLGTITTVIIGAVLAALWLGIQAKVTGHG